MAGLLIFDPFGVILPNFTWTARWAVAAAGLDVGLVRMKLCCDEGFWILLAFKSITRFFCFHLTGNTLISPIDFIEPALVKY